MNGSEWAATIPGVGAVIGTILVFVNSRKELRQKSNADYVTLTKAAADLVLEQITNVRAEAKSDLERYDKHIAAVRAEARSDRQRCERNIAKLRAALLAAGVDVPDLEFS